ncbi:MAG: hypothetical protein MMC23_005033 [Stictis urceolatum]|nr:hypothetical protein [Stictis urceolata]
MLLTSGLISVLATAFNLVSATPIRRQTAAGRYIFSFGDSYTAIGFDINGTQPNQANPVGNPPVPGAGQQDGTTSLGPNYIHYLTLQYNTTETYTFDFAQSGATVSNDITPVGIPAFKDQVPTFYEPKYSSKPADIAPWTSDNAFFTVFFGINDIENNYRTNNISTLIPETQQVYFSLVQNLYDTGARKFVFINVPPLDKSPRVMPENPPLWSQWQQTWNSQLATNAQSFAASHTDAQAVVYDFATFFEGVLDNPTAQGFQDATCIGNGGPTCIWADSFHPGYTMDSKWANDMIPTLTQIGW